MSLVTRNCTWPGCATPFEVATNNNRKLCDEHTRNKLSVTVAEPIEGSDDPEVLARRRMERLEEENRQLRSALSKSRKEDMKAEEIREKCYELAGVAPSPPTWLSLPTQSGVPGVPSTTWSDWHFGEVVNGEEVAYVNEFNTPIGIDRAHRLMDVLLDICFSHMVNPVYPGLVINLGGDMMTGDIHEELQDTNDRYSFQTLLDLQDTITAALTLAADRFGNVFVPAVVGNHGRNTHKPRMKGRAYTSFEWHLYNQLERYFQNDPRVQFLVSNETDAHYRIYNQRYMLTHGDSLGVKGGDGIIGSLGPIMRGVIKVGRAQAQIGRDFDTLVMGHWHQWISLRGVEVNGSLKGYDEYARTGLRASFEPPIQALWFTSEKHGKTAKWPLYLTDEQKPADLPWVSWQAA